MTRDIEDMTDAQDETRVTVKPLEWHKSHMRPWRDDYHTVPTAYTVRCADENGWRWSGYGGHGYCSSPEAARYAAQSDWERRIRDAVIVRAALARPSQDMAGDALVSFARPFADALDIECDFMTPPAPFEDGFDVRSRARAALAAMDTPKGGGDE